MLFSSLQSQSVSHLTICIARDTNQSPGHTAFMLILDGKKGSMWTAVSKRNTESLRISKHKIGAEFTRRFEKRERE